MTFVDKYKSIYIYIYIHATKYNKIFKTIYTYTFLLLWSVGPIIQHRKVGDNNAVTLVATISRWRWWSRFEHSSSLGDQPDCTLSAAWPQTGNCAMQIKLALYLPTPFPKTWLRETLRDWEKLFGPLKTCLRTPLIYIYIYIYMYIYIY